MAALTIVPASGAVTTVLTATHIYVTDCDSNAADGTEITYRIRARKAGVDDLISHAFSPNADGKHQWDNVIFPDDGTWTVTLRDSDDTQIATTSVVVI